VVTYPFYFNSSFTSSYASSINLPLVSSFNSNFLSTTLTSYTINTYPFFYRSSFTIPYTSSINTTNLINFSTLVSTLISSYTINTYPFYFNSSFVSSYTSSIPLTIVSSNSTFLSTSVSSVSVITFPYIFNSSLVSSYTSSVGLTIISTLTNALSSFISTGVLANSYYSDFINSGIGFEYPGTILTQNLWLGTGLTNLINTGNYNVYVNFDYSLYLSTTYDNFTWVNTQGSLNALGNPLFTFGNKGSSNTMRVGNSSYTQVNANLLFNPNPSQMPANISNFQLQIILNSSINATSILPPYYNIYIPAQNNFVVTLQPLT
jgi:hypothetical protein